MYYGSRIDKHKRSATIDWKVEGEVYAASDITPAATNCTS